MKAWDFKEAIAVKTIGISHLRRCVLSSLNQRFKWERSFSIGLLTRGKFALHEKA